MKTTETTTLQEFEDFLSEFSSQDVPPIVCSWCDKPIGKTKKVLRRIISEYKRPNKPRKTFLIFCSRSCSGKFYNPEGSVEGECAVCRTHVIRSQAEFQKSKSGKLFCSRSCSATHRNTHKTSGTRRSKLELWIEQELSALYPNLEFHFNRKDAINSELDIYIPSLRLAFELNGIYHYEPIHGEEKLSQIQNNDNRKFQACIENGIELCIIDTSSLVYFKPEKAKKYLDIILRVINGRLS